MKLYYKKEGLSFVCNESDFWFKNFKDNDKNVVSNIFWNDHIKQKLYLDQEVDFISRCLNKKHVSRQEDYWMRLV